jgi:GalNAc-alpha-(1->4)-GalNAc-alpha-(1->3)-diNAcBac-PP-undecaprenol alpha-1,4-N-acetyl-D-galactosaminyltransferase
VEADKNKKLVFVTESLTHGGAERVLVDLANKFSKQGVQVTVILLSCFGMQDFYQLESSVRCIRLHEKSRLLNLSFPKGPLAFLIAVLIKIYVLRKVLRSLRVGEQSLGLFSFMTQPSIVCILAGLGLGVRVVACERVHPDFNLGVMGRIGRFFAFPFAAWIVSQTECAARQYPFWLQSKIKVVPNSVTHFPIQNHELKRKPFILAVGRLVDQKDFELLIRVFAQIHQRIPGWSLRIVGEGPLRERLIRCAFDLGVSEKVQILSNTKKIWECYDECEIFVLSSRYEGFPNVLLEAMSRGCACVAIDCPSGPRDLIVDGQNGFLISVGDEQMLADRLIQLAGDCGIRREMGALAKQKTIQYDSEVVFQSWIKIANEL